MLICCNQCCLFGLFPGITLRRPIQQPLSAPIKLFDKGRRPIVCFCVDLVFHHRINSFDLLLVGHFKIVSQLLPYYCCCHSIRFSSTPALQIYNILLLLHRRLPSRTTSRFHRRPRSHHHHTHR